MSPKHHYSFSVNQEAVVIDFIKANRCLWSVSDSGYRNREMRDSLFAHLAAALGTDAEGFDYTPESIKFKWKNLRTTFQREAKKVDDSQRGGDDISNVYRPKWIHFKSMIFLKDSGANTTDIDREDVKQEATNLFEQFMHCEDSQSVDNDSAASSAWSTPPRPPQQSSTVTSLPPPSVKSSVKRKATDLEDNSESLDQLHKLQDTLRSIEEKISCLNDLPELNPELIFGKHVGMSLQNINNRYNREMAKLKIQEILLKYSFDNDND